VEAATGTPHALTGASTTIGRKAGGVQSEAKVGLVAIADPYLSREHAQILMHDGHCWLVDLDSANGSFVNSRPVAGPTPLSPGDTLSLGTTSLWFLASPPLTEGDRG
jgi:pSer/pThr/pTyr-binding forkhead associated (FHA) protein